MNNTDVKVCWKFRVRFKIAILYFFANKCTSLQHILYLLSAASSTAHDINLQGVEIFLENNYTLHNFKDFFRSMKILLDLLILNFIMFNNFCIMLVYHFSLLYIHLVKKQYIHIIYDIQFIYQKSKLLFYVFGFGIEILVIGEKSLLYIYKPLFI